MNDARSRKMSVTTISMLIVVSTFGLNNVVDNLAEMGLAAIPSWLADIRARRRGMDAPFKMVRSTSAAVGIGVVTLVVSTAGYLGAGLHVVDTDPIDWIYVGIVYAGPIALISLGLLLRALSLRSHDAG